MERPIFQAISGGIDCTFTAKKQGGLLNHVEAPTTTDILTTTIQPAGPRFDILFLIDVSQQAERRLNDIKGFVSKLMSGYGVSQQNARVALMAVGSAQMGSIPFANFDTIDSYENLLNYIEMVKQYTDFKHAGQAIEQFDDHPREIAEKIRKEGKYGIITVGYGTKPAGRALLQVSVEY
ncbi:von Willebrand factor type A domain protein [Ostertagia ostertagi]